MSILPELEEQRDTKLRLVVRNATREILRALKAQSNKSKGQIIDQLVEAEGLKVLGRDQVESIRQRTRRTSKRKD